MTYKELAELYRELYLKYETYTNLLVDELEEVVPIAFASGWRSCRFDEGVKMRKEIEDLRINIDHKILDEITKISQEQGSYE